MVQIQRLSEKHLTLYIILQAEFVSRSLVSSLTLRTFHSSHICVFSLSFFPPFRPHKVSLSTLSPFCSVLCSTEAFSAERGAREGATKVMIVMTDGESHDGEELPDALVECESRNITRYAIAVSSCPNPNPKSSAVKVTVTFSKC